MKNIIWLSCILLHVTSSSCQLVSYTTTVGSDKIRARMVRSHDASKNITIFLQQLDLEKVGVSALNTKVIVASKIVDGSEVSYNVSLHKLVPTPDIASNMLWFDDQLIEKDQKQSYDGYAATYSDEVVPEDTILSEFKKSLIERHLKCLTNRQSYTKPSWLPD